MTLELLLLCSLIFVFIVSFCGLLQKIKQSYERERAIAAEFYAERMARRHTTRNEDNSDAYVNTTFVEDFDTGSGIFPSAPPPYTHMEEPPKYEDIIKAQDIIRVVPSVNTEPTRAHSYPPPPYSITT